MIRASVLLVTAMLAAPVLCRAVAAGDLAWLLGPTAVLAGWLSGVPFMPSPGGEYLNVEQGIAIGRSCAGARFYVVALLLGAFAALPGCRRDWHLAVALAAVVGGAWLATVTANASRIAGAILLLRLDAARGRLAPAAIHQAEGTVVFAVCLVGYFFAVRALTERGRR